MNRRSFFAMLAGLFFVPKRKTEAMLVVTPQRVDFGKYHRERILDLMTDPDVRSITFHSNEEVEARWSYWTEGGRFNEGVTKFSARRMKEAKSGPFQIEDLQA
jgi:hypothetical protein